LATDVKKTSDEYGILFANLLTAAEIPSQRLSGAIISSVVPALTWSRTVAAENPTGGTCLR